MQKPNLDNIKDMVLCGILSSENVDSSGEICDMKGMDISSLEEGNAPVNYEHLGASDGVGREIVGKIIFCKKIYNIADCENDDERFFFKQTREKPYLFGIIRLADGAGHHEAQDLAAHIRDAVAHNEEISLRYSIEGSTVTKEGNVIKESIARKVALTFGPANKAVKNKILADPNAPEGFDKISIAKAEIMQDPTCRKLSTVEVFGNPIVGSLRDFSKAVKDQDPINRLIKNITTIKVLKKALEAGCGEGAPSTLTQGAALQKEDLGKVYKNNVLAAIRDYDKPFSRNDFKKYLKSYLAKASLQPISESFLDHFTDVAESSKLKKSVDESQSQLEPLRKKPALASPDESVIEDNRDEAPTVKPKFLTFRGKKLKPNEKVKRLTVDSKRGVLHTPLGSFKFHNPSTESPELAQHFQDCMNSPHTNKIMKEALKGWHQVHLLNKAGELPEEVPLTATILSVCSGNRPVPLTELQTVRIVDAMRNSGVDIRQPGFENIMPHLKDLDQPDVLPVTGRQAIAKDPAYYIGGKIGVDKDLFGGKAGKPNEQGRYPGELKTINPLLSDTVKNLSSYYKAHKGLVELVNKHKHNMTAAVRELVGMKQAGVNWQNRRRTIIAEGKTDPGEYKGLTIPGIKVKTGLYAYGMMGGGDSIVPDTHFIRHMFGLDTTKDADTLKYLKKQLWSPNNYPVIEQYNDWYRTNHPAFKWMVNHPEFGKMFAEPKDATFPAFWANWINIPGYEKKLGTSKFGQANNTGSTHAPYWAAIEPHVTKALSNLGKSADFDTTMPLRAALIMQHYVKDYGEIPAQIMYYQHLVPKLLECAKHRQDLSSANLFLRKTMQLEGELVELRKSMRHLVEGGHSVALPEVYTVESADKKHLLGRFMVSRGKVHHLEDYHSLLEQMVPEGPLTADKISKIHGLVTSPHFTVQEQTSPNPSDIMDGVKVSSEGGTPPEQEKQPIVIKQAEPKKPAVFSYFRSGMAKPHVVEFSPEGAALDGKALSSDELTLMLENARKGLAKITWGAPEDLAKREPTEDLMDSDEALQHVRAAVLAGHLHPSVERALTKHIYEDSMVPGIGNKYAAQRFREQNKPGVYASIDLNDFKSVNDVHGHDAGDDAIKAFGGAMADASKKVGTTKSFRPGGDEFVIYTPTHSDMARTLGHLRENVDKLPPVGGTHKSSFSVGLGHTFAVADQALNVAKKGKLDPVTKQRLYEPGKVPHLGYSLYPGSEGEIFKKEETAPKAALGAVPSKG